MTLTEYIVLIANVLVAVGLMTRLGKRIRQHYQLHRQPIIPQYEPPKGLAPAHLSILDSPHGNQNDITATLVDLVNRQIIKLELVKPKAGWRSANYQISLLQPTNKLPQFEETLLVGILQGKKSALLSDLLLNNRVYQSQVNEFRYRLGDAIASKGYSQHSLTAKAYWITAVSLWAAVGYFTLMAITMETSPNAAYSPIAALVCLLCAILYLWLTWLPSGRTKKGMALWAKIQGFKQYLEVAEQDRLNFRHPPLKSVAHFDELLPYAIALGVENQWARHFEGLTVAPNLIDWEKASAKLDNDTATLVGTMTNDIRRAFSPGKYRA